MPIPKSCMELGRLIISEAHKASPDYMRSKKESRKDEETIIKVRTSKNKGVLSVRGKKKKGSYPLSLHKWYTDSGLTIQPKASKSLLLLGQSLSQETRMS